MSSPEIVDRLSLALLDSAEGLEYALLSWGFLDGSFTPEELQELADGVIARSEAAGTTSGELIDWLKRRRMLFRLPGGAERYRTRFAEAIRLFARLRQMFRPGQWENAPALVADFRLSLQPRRYPARSISPGAALEVMRRARPLSAFEERAVAALLQRPDATEYALARFQVEATSRLLSPPGDGHGGMIVSAGTGTGKTLAFYLPCLVTIAARMERNVHWTQALALYPRTELLKDQFAEAYLLARKLDSQVQETRGRKIRIGAYFQSTPYAANERSMKGDGDRPKWPEHPAGFVCPFLRCPRCESELLWLRGDLQAGREALTCAAAACGHRIGDDEVILTRTGLRAAPPEILFSTSEMLNRRMSSAQDRRVFGLSPGRQRPPWVMLLDEVHTYTGPHGAQVALLIRRWTKEVGAPLQFVGLSATLSDPQQFFADLTGLTPGRVTPISPERDLEEEGREYHLALRGDPVSGANLLSTTIQAAMLMGRVLDPLDDPVSGDLFSRKVFVFTDDLDVTNRLYHTLLDAEGRYSNGGENARKMPLASLRGPGHPRREQRFWLGQYWALCQDIGHALNAPVAERLRIGRTSSQDRGVDFDSQVIVATAALEVGFNDPHVGAVIQHKAPHSAAAFLQRKGRAGRLRVTRPWTVAVLSDYGRDRMAYQAYEQLFDPVLERPNLPVNNRYVLRMQAVYAFMDWLCTRLAPEFQKVNVWDDLTGPADEDSPRRRHQKAAAAVILRVLTDPETRAQLEQHFSNALKIPVAEVRALFWEPPRALMTAVLPTLYRRLCTGWQRIEHVDARPGVDRRARFTPVPEFIPDNLFSDLSVPEVVVLNPVQKRQRGNTSTLVLEEETMGVLQALRTLPPGRVTRRFGTQDIRTAHWVQPTALVSGLHALPVDQYCTGEVLGCFELSRDGRRTQVPCVRPIRIQTELCPNEVRISSNAQQDWQSQIFTLDQGTPGPLPDGSFLSGLIRDVRFFTHNQRKPVRVRRFSLGSQASLLMRDGTEHSLYVQYTDPSSGNQAAVGLEQDVDGIRFGCVIADELLRRCSEGAALRSGRLAFFQHQVAHDPTLLRHAQQNTFRLGWLSQLFLVLLLARALGRGCSLEEAARHYETTDWAPALQYAMRVIFQVLAVDEARDAGEAEEDAPSANSDEPYTGRIHKAVTELLGEEEVRRRLLELAPVLWNESGPEWFAWLRRRLSAALGGALLQACYDATPRFQAGDLYLDLESGVQPDYAVQHDEEAIWITESLIGGGGVVEEVVRSYMEDPRRFFLLVEAALQPSDLEVVDQELTRLVRWLGADPELADALAAVRAAQSNRELELARDQLLHTLRRKHFLLTHPVLTSLNARIARPGSSELTDRLLAELLDLWDRREAELGVEIDARLFAYLATTVPGIRERVGAILEDVGGETIEDRQRVYSVVLGLIWTRGSMVRERTLESYHPFHPPPPTDPLLLRNEIRHNGATVRVEDAGWMTHAARCLADHGSVRIEAAFHSREMLAEALLDLSHQPVETGFLRLYPYLARMESFGETLVATLHLREAVQ